MVGIAENIIPPFCPSQVEEIQETQIQNLENNLQAIIILTATKLLSGGTTMPRLQTGER